MLRVVVCTEPPIQNVLIDTRRICIFIMASEFSWGRLTPQQVQKIANLAHLDHEGCKDWAKIHNMARIGESGHISGNAYRDLMRTLPPSRLPRAHKIKIPVQHKLLGRANPKLPFCSHMKYLLRFITHIQLRFTLCLHHLERSSASGMKPLVTTSCIELPFRSAV